MNNFDVKKKILVQPPLVDIKKPGDVKIGDVKIDGQIGVDKVKADVKVDGPKGLDKATEVGPVVSPTSNRAAKVVALLQNAGLTGDVATFVARLRSGLGDIDSVRKGMVEAFGAAGDFLWSNDLKEMMEPARVAALKAQTETIAKFSAGLNRAESLGELLSLADSHKDTWLPAASRNELMLRIRRKDIGASIEHYEKTAARFPAFGQDDIGQEYYLVALNKAAEAGIKAATKASKALAKEGVGTEADVQKLVDTAAGLLNKSIIEGKRHIAQRSSAFDEAHPEFVRVSPDVLKDMPDVSDERLAALGKAFKVAGDLLKLGTNSPHVAELKAMIGSEASTDPFGKVAANLDYATEALKVSTRYYESAYAQDFGYYPAMPSIYNNLELGNVDRAMELAKMAKVSCNMAGGVESPDYWVLISQLEIALITNDDALAHQLAPKVLSMAKEGWQLDTTAGWMQKLVDLRSAKGEDTKVIGFMAKELGARANALYGESGARDKIAEQFKDSPAIRDKALETLKKDQAAGANQWEAATLKTLDGLVDNKVVAPSDEVLKGRATAEAIRGKSITTRNLTSSHSAGGTIRIEGNTAHGGQIPEMAITRATRRIGMALLKEWGITPETPKAEFHAILNTEITRMYNLEDPANGVRWLEDMYGAAHKPVDAFDQLRFVLMMSKALGDDATELMTLGQIGVGDCRPTNYTGEYLSTLYQRNVEVHQLQQAFRALPGGINDKKLFEKSMDSGQESMLWEPRVGTAKMMGYVKMKAPYVYDLDANGNKQRSDKLEHIENHTFMFWMQTDKDGVPTDLRAKDMFYHDYYPLADLKLDPSEIHSPDGFTGGKMGFTFPDGTSPDFTIKLSDYSGKLVTADIEKEAVSGGSFFAGQELAPATLAGMKQGALKDKQWALAMQFMTLRNEIHATYGDPEHKAPAGH